MVSWLRVGDRDGLMRAIRRAVAAEEPPSRFRRRGAMAAIGG